MSKAEFFEDVRDRLDKVYQHLDCLLGLIEEYEEESREEGEEDERPD